MLAITPQTRIVALDLETTGLSATRHRIVELAAVCWQHGREIGHFQALVNPGCFIPHGVIRIHGITDTMVSDKPPIKDVLPDFLAFCMADVIVAHNAPFDMRFLETECARAGIPSLRTPVVDTCALAKQRLSMCPNFRLETLKAALGLGRRQAHRALDDARDCLAVFLHCLQTDPPSLHLPIEPPPLPTALAPLREALTTGGTVVIEYCDSRGHITQREIQPIFIDATTMQAHCLLRNDTRHFALDRIQRAWRPEHFLP